MKTNIATQSARQRSRLRRQAIAAPVIVEAAPEVATPALDYALTFCGVDEDGQLSLFDAPADVDDCVFAEEDTEAPFIDEPVAVDADDPPFDPPDADDEILNAAPRDEDEPPFDAPDFDEEETPTPAVATLDDAATFEAEDTFEAPQLAAPTTVDTPAPTEPQRLFSRNEPDGAAERELPVPPISIHVSWDRGETVELMEKLRADPRMARAKINAERGGLDGAVMRFRNHDSPNLLIVDTTLRGAEMLGGLDRLAEVMQSGAKVIVIGAVNDVTLLRELKTRGVSEYIMAPAPPDQLARTVCGLFADTERSFETRVIAVVGARGGVGASTIAHNLAWSIAERQLAGATLLDLDLSFGASAYNFDQHPPMTIADALRAADRIDDVLLERVIAKPAPRLKLVTTPGALEAAPDLDPPTLDALLARARRTSPFVILDLPHAWTGWVKHALTHADDVLVVAAPDLASLRNAKSMLDFLRVARGDDASVNVALSMTEAPKRPEISFKDFADAIGARPLTSFAFDPALYGAAALNGQMLAQAAPRSKAALAIDELATQLTGREPVVELALPVSDDVLDLTDVAAAPRADDKLAALRHTARAELQVQQQSRKLGRSRHSIFAATAGFMLTLSAGGAWLAYSSDAALLGPATAQAAAVPRQPIDTLAPLRAAAEAGDAQAQYRLAKSYERAADLLLARQWTERAAGNGDARAMHDLGVYYARGEGGVDVDAVAAFRWFRQAAELGVADSQYNLGVLYQDGRGVNADAHEALFWYLVAARGQDTGADARIAAAEAALTPLQIEQARARATAFAARE
ncbi:MAG: AAA family ATPase [Hyphomonadaceae bacterium]